MDNEMIILEITKLNRDAKLVQQLLNLWESSVIATHKFLTLEDIRKLTPAALNGISEISILLIAEDKNNRRCGFCGIENKNIEMLFVAPNFIGQGIGRQLIKTAIENYNAEKVDVNEQNPVAKRFYEHIGFAVENRSECDDYGNPFPILHMSLRK